MPARPATAPYTAARFGRSRNPFFSRRPGRRASWQAAPSDADEAVTGIIRPGGNFACGGNLTTNAASRPLTSVGLAATRFHFVGPKTEKPPPEVWRPRGTAIQTKGEPGGLADADKAQHPASPQAFRPAPKGETDL